MAVVEYQNIKKVFGAVTVIPDASLHIPDGSFTVFVGPSGCGKSTLLRLTAGLEDATDGKIFIDARDVTEERPTERGIAMVFQSYALYPHMDVAENIGFALKMAKVPKAEIKAKVEAAADVLQLTPLLKRKPAELSGGQRQRVAIGRAIVRQPKVFLFDEPLSNLDAALRTQMRVELAQLHKRLGATMIYVTHDQVEAMTLADQIVVLNKGLIEQVGAPIDLYNKPETLFVAGFIGSPKMNFFTGPLAAAVGAHTLGVRPEHLDVDRKDGLLSGSVQFSERLGSDTYLHVAIDGIGIVIARAVGDAVYGAGETVWLSYAPEMTHRFDEAGKRL
jgi:multiple sugar transport system ATP-binding protein